MDYSEELKYHLSHKDLPYLKTDCRWCGTDNGIFDLIMEAFREGVKYMNSVVQAGPEDDR